MSNENGQKLLAKRPRHCKSTKMSSITDLSIQQLRHITNLKERIEELQDELLEAFVSYQAGVASLLYFYFTI